MNWSTRCVPSWKSTRWWEPAYLQIMVINGATKSYLLVLDAPKDDALFKAAGDAARPFLVSNEKKMNLNITISTSPLGQQGMARQRAVLY